MEIKLMNKLENKERKEKCISKNNNPAVVVNARVAGITLIALVITIIVLLILASISINLLFRK